MSSLPPYSVLMSVYAKEKPEFLDAAIESMVRQSVAFHDMVVVCDGPLTEALDEVLYRWKGLLGNRLVVHRLEENGGLGRALAAGLPLCDCDIVARMDSDDLSRPNRCELLLNAMVDKQLDLVGGAIEEFNELPGDLGSVRRTPLEQQEIREFARRRNPFNHVTVAFKRGAVSRAGGYEPFYLLEDYWLWARMLAGGCACANVAEIVVDVRVGQGMHSRRRSVAYLRSQVKLFTRFNNMGFISRGDYLRAIAERTISTIIPVRMVQMAYTKLLRSA